jgi:hypothetical protein
MLPEALVPTLAPAAVGAVVAFGDEQVRRFRFEPCS